MRLFTSFLFALGLLSAHAPLCGQEERIDSLRLNRTEVNKQLLHSDIVMMITYNLCHLLGS